MTVHFVLLYLTFGSHTRTLAKKKNASMTHIKCIDRPYKYLSAPIITINTRMIILNFFSIKKNDICITVKT
ncbi:hypothetical protein F4703DRAFT_1378407 [Phycomyces blakesleeanus]